ncbi:MAG: MFS transporter [Dehalococcoidia bacterium]
MTGRSFYFLVAALWLGNFMPALDQTMVLAALPTVVGALNGIELYAWVFAAYLLALTIAIPIFGKLADLFGRKPVYYFGMGLFALGAITSSLAQNVEQLIACRVLTGLATACVQPVAQTIMGDAFPMAQRARLQWIFASAWFVASLLGPLLGSALIAFASWRLVFLVTVPIGLIAVIIMATQYHETVERHAHRIDFAGVFLLGAGVLALLFALSPTDRTAGIGAQSLGLIAVSAALLVAFIWNELRASEPVLPPRLFLVPVVGIAALGSLGSGVVQSGATSFITIFVQGGQGASAAEAGLVLGVLTMGWPVGAGLGGRFLMRIGFRRTIIAGMALTATATLGLLLLDRGSSTLTAIGWMTLMGLGFGFSSVGITISVQNSVTWSERGVATASMQFFRSIGGSVGVAVMGTIMGMRLQPLLDQYQLSGAEGGANALLKPAARDALPPEVLAALQQALTEGIHQAFYVMAFAALAATVAVLWFPRTLREPTEPARASRVPASSHADATAAD